MCIALIERLASLALSGCPRYLLPMWLHKHLVTIRWLVPCRNLPSGVWTIVGFDPSTADSISVSIVVFGFKSHWGRSIGSNRLTLDEFDSLLCRPAVADETKGNETRLMMRAISFTHYQAFYPACQPQSAAASVMLAPAGRDSNLHSDQHLVLVFVNSKISLNPGQSYYRVWASISLRLASFLPRSRPLPLRLRLPLHLPPCHWE